MPLASRIRKDARLSFIAKQVYGPVPQRVYVARPARPQVALQRDTQGTTYLHSGQTCTGIRVAANAVALLHALLEE